MKIILATPLYPPEIGGPATYTKELAEHLRGEHDVTIVAFASTSEPVLGVKLITVSKRRLLPIRLAKFAWVLFKAAKNADVMYVQNAVAAGLPAVLVGRLRRVPVVLKFVGDESWERATQVRLTTKTLEAFLDAPDVNPKIRTIRQVQGFVLRRARIVTTPSAYLKDILVRYYGVTPDRVVVNYNAAEKVESLPFTAEPVRHQIATTARLVEWKGIAGIIRATYLLTKEFPDIKLLIAGDGPEEEKLKQLAAQLKVEKHITFLGRVSRAQTWHIRKTSEVYVLNSNYEGLPHTALTSFAAGIPMVATNIPGTNEAVYHEHTGLLIPPGDDHALAEAIARLFKNEVLRQSLIEGGQKILQEKFSWDSHKKKLLEILESVISHPRNEA